MHRTFSKLMTEKSRQSYFDNEKLDIEDTSLMLTANNMDESGKRTSKPKNKGEGAISVIHSFLPQLVRFN